MKVFKFGGASVKDAQSVTNVRNILSVYQGEPLCVVFSAMGKTTNALEKLTEAWVKQDMVAFELLDDIEKFHQLIAEELLKDAHKAIQPLFTELRRLLQAEPPVLYDSAYDQLVPFGELLSAAIVSAYLHQNGLYNRLLDARNLIITDESFRNGRIQWEETTKRIVSAFSENVSGPAGLLTITQGFIGSSLSGHPVTLGREGSDFSAAIFAFALDAKEMIIWKDVPGVMNADPHIFKNTVKLNRITYRDAIELAYFGASVIHPKTIQPLQNKSIPLWVKSFERPKESGTLIHTPEKSDKHIPSFIVKPNQVLLSISPKDFSFIAEDGLHTIFGLLAHMGIRINLMQNSAISFSICIDNQPHKLQRLLSALSGDFRVKYNDNTELVTIRYYDQKTIDQLVNKRNVLLEQKSRLTIQMIVEQQLKNKTAEPAAEAVAAEETPVVQQVKKRGRPPVVKTTAQDEEADQPVKKRGRPSKKKTE